MGMFVGECLELRAEAGRRNHEALLAVLDTGDSLGFRTPQRVGHSMTLRFMVESTTT